MADSDNSELLRDQKINKAIICTHHMFAPSNLEKDLRPNPEILHTSVNVFIIRNQKCSK